MIQEIQIMLGSKLKYGIFIMTKTISLINESKMQLLQNGVKSRLMYASIPMKSYRTYSKKWPSYMMLFIIEYNKFFSIGSLKNKIFRLYNKILK